MEQLSSNAIHEHFEAREKCKAAMEIQAVIHGKTTELLSIDRLPLDAELLLLVTFMGVFLAYKEDGEFKYKSINFGQIETLIRKKDGTLIGAYRQHPKA